VYLCVRYIVVVRNPYDAAVSYFRFLQGWWVDYDDAFFEHFTEQNLLQRSWSSFVRYFGHVKTWMSKFDSPNVLFVAYEQLMVWWPLSSSFELL